MPSERERETRIGSAVNSLVRQLIPAFPGEDGASIEDRRDTAHELAMSILQR